MTKILLVFGTRPEVIKMAPIIMELEKHKDRIRPILCVTAQHRQLLDQFLDFFQIQPDYDLNLMEKNQSLPQLTARIITSIDPLLTEIEPDWVLVQGDTTTTMAVTLEAFYQGIKVGHVEAGLRSYDKHAPFPEEINRKITSVIADLHFAPTERARQSLLSEGVPEASIFLTGNTVVDALVWARENIRGKPPRFPEGFEEKISGKRMILVTGHRRESFGPKFEQICLALKELAQDVPDINIVYPVHLNPNVQAPVHRILGGIESIQLIDPLSYPQFVSLMDKAHLILTDSGGIQEEAPSLGKPVLVMRETTERQEGIDAGNACLVGTNKENIVQETLDLLKNSERYRKMSQSTNPYGDGKAAQRIVRILLDF